jgi:hypothetical protein
VLDPVWLLLHRYVTPPVALNVVGEPAQIDTLPGVAVITGGTLVVTVIVSLSAHPDGSVAVTEYVPLPTVTLWLVALVLHKYVLPGLPASSITFAKQIDVSGPRFTTGWLLIVTNTVSVPEQPACVNTLTA